MVSPQGLKGLPCPPARPLESHIFRPYFFVARNSSSEYTNFPPGSRRIVIRTYIVPASLARGRPAPRDDDDQQDSRKTGFLPLVMAFINTLFLFWDKQASINKGTHVGQPASVLFALFSLAGDSPPGSPKEQNPRKIKAVRCEAVLAGAEMLADKEKTAENTLCILKGFDAV